MRQYMKGAIVAGLVFILAGCQTQAASREYEVNGVLAVDPASKTLELDHEEIPGYMKAMKMKYPVADAKLLDGFKVGDSVLDACHITHQDRMAVDLPNDDVAEAIWRLHSTPGPQRD